MSEELQVLRNLHSEKAVSHRNALQCHYKFIDYREAAMRLPS
jgi:hypothetical protein